MFSIRRRQGTAQFAKRISNLARRLLWYQVRKTKSKLEFHAADDDDDDDDVERSWLTRIATIVVMTTSSCRAKMPLLGGTFGVPASASYLAWPAEDSLSWNKHTYISITLYFCSNRVKC